jgi:hypothetical protein
MMTLEEVVTKVDRLERLVQELSDSAGKAVMSLKERAAELDKRVDALETKVG